MEGTWLLILACGYNADFILVSSKLCASAMQGKKHALNKKITFRLFIDESYHIKIHGWMVAQWCSR